MRTASLTFSLLWRLVVTWLVVSLVLLAANSLAHKAGVSFPPTEWANSVAFIKLKPSLMYGASAFVVLATEVLLQANPLQAIAGRKLCLPRDAWRKLSIGLASLLLGLAVLNGVVAAVATLEVWLQYKLFGAMSCLVLGVAVLAKRARSAQQSAA